MGWGESKGVFLLITDLPPYVPIATQIPQAAGAAWASKYKNESACSLVYFGDGATSDHV
ncbi:thiamine pyrophosphate-dependent enzyme [Paenibacillus alvei]|uniref:thiamine pyrophosphate-dependent enzyme n=1 Tax=Paenibacillus alvei TaxID=44250 RepID=UPI002E140EB2|nr:thiamine pyrophosphate-dependent enzyme [Paenibacillus alvei]